MAGDDKKPHDEDDFDGDGDGDILALDDDQLDELGDGIQLGDSQADEIKRIFLTTLPQYLEPVAEMIEQIGAPSPDEENSEALEALTATLLSLTTAAARIGESNVHQRLEAMHALVAQYEGAQDNLPPSLAPDLKSILDEIRDIAGGGEVTSSLTIVAALQGREGVDPGVLTRLTAAGVVTVEQLKMGRIHEVVAVSGQETHVVEKLVALLDDAGETAPPGRMAAEGSKNNVLELELKPDALLAQYEGKLRLQVDLETTVEELRLAIQKKRYNNSILREKWEAAQKRQRELEEALKLAEEDHRERLATVGELSRRKNELTRHHQAEDTKRQDLERRILQVRSKRDALEEEQSQFDEEVRELEKTLRNMLERMAKKVHCAGEP